MKLISIKGAIIGLAALLVALAVIQIPVLSESSESVAGEMLPAFELPLLHDETSMLRSESLKGQVTILNVWASWCVPCRLEHPLLMDLSQDKSLNLYGVNHRDLRADALKWLEFYGNPYYLTMFDSVAESGAGFGASGVPETYLVDRHGNIRYRHHGALTRTTWQEEFLPLISHLQGKQ